MSKWFAGKFLEGNVQLAISEMKISFPKIFGAESGKPSRRQIIRDL